MTPDKFLQLRESDWKALDDLLKQATDRPESLSTADAERLGSLYRATSSDLAIAQRDYPKARLTAYLNQLVGRTHSLLYKKLTLSAQAIRRYFQVEIPRAFRRNVRQFVVAMLFLRFQQGGNHLMSIGLFVDRQNKHGLISTSHPLQFHLLHTF